MYLSTMRIACIFVPHVPLQALVRRRMELRKQLVIVVSAGPASSVLACSRASYAQGVRVGMTAMSARQLCPTATMEPRDVSAEVQLQASMVEALYGLSSRVEAEDLRRGHGGDIVALRADAVVNAVPAWQSAGTIFAEVPTGMRGATFGARVLELAATLDVAVRVGIADDRFTAWVAAKHGSQSDEQPVTAIPRGGSAAFLAPQSLSLLDISPEVQHMLVALGVRTLGHFASLPAPSVARRWDYDLQSLARGEGGAELRPIQPSFGPLQEEILVGEEIGLGAAVSRLAERAALRLVGRGGVAAAMEVTSYTERGAESVTLWLVPPLDQAETLADRIARAVADGPVHRLRISLTVAHAGEATPLTRPMLAIPASDGAEGLAGDAPPDMSSSIGMSSSLLRWSASGNAGALKSHRRTRRGKQRRRVVPAQARLFGND